MDIIEHNRRWDMIAIKKDIDKIFEHFLNPELLPKIKIENHIDDLPCVVIADGIIISGIKVESGGLIKGYRHGFEIHTITTEHNYPHEPDWYDYKEQGQFTRVREVSCKALKLYLHYELGVLEEYEYFEDMAKELKECA